MKIAVCVRQGTDGEISPFDACAYEAALRIENAEIVLVSMGPPSTADFLSGLTRLGAEKAVLLSDKAFAGADTLATAYTLSLALKKLSPELVFCGRQTLVGDTAQTGPMLSVYLGASLITNAMSIKDISGHITCETRNEGIKTADFPAVVTFERVNTLRLPSIFSKVRAVEALNAEDLKADTEKCGLKGSPTRVTELFENKADKRKCEFISPNELTEVIKSGLKAEDERLSVIGKPEKLLMKVCTVGNAPYPYAKTVSDDITVLPLTDEISLCEKITELNPNAVLWASDDFSKALAARVGARLGVGLCADCTSLETDGEELYMYRPAMSGSVTAKIKSITKPTMATVRTLQKSSDIVIAVGYGARHCVGDIKKYAEKIGADTAATRKAVDNNILPYSLQVGLTGKRVSPRVYIALGVSGAVHHIVGMKQSGTVIAVNTDKNADIFEYADYGITADAAEVLKYLSEN